VERRVRKRPWTHRDGRAAWIEVLVTCDKLPDLDEVTPPLITCLDTVARTWSPRGGATVLREQIDKICSRYGIAPADGISSKGSTSMPAIPQAHIVEDVSRAAQVGGRHLLPTLKSGWRALTSDGQGSYQIAMISFGMAAFLFHHSLQPLKVEQEYLRANLKTSRDPVASGPLPVIDSLLLPGTNGRGTPRGDAHPLCDERIIAWLDEASATFHAEYAKERAYPHQLGRVPSAGPLRTSPPWTDDDPSSTLTIPSALAYAAERYATFRTPAWALVYGPRPRLGALAAGAPPDRTPSPADAASPPPVDPCKRRGAAAVLHCLLREQIERSTAVSALARFLGERPTPGGLTRITRFHFITPDGVERSIPHFNPSILPPDHLPQAESYVRRALAHDAGVFAADGPKECRQFGTDQRERTGTYPYFSPLGAGIQQTACYPVTDVSTGESKIAGVLCADVAVPWRVVLSRLEEAGEAFELSLVEVTQGGTNVRSCRELPWAGLWWIPGQPPVVADRPCSANLAQLDDDQSEILARGYYNTGLRPFRRSPFGLRGATRLSSSDRFGVVVAAATPDQGPWYIAIGRHHASKSRNYTSLALCTLMLLGGVTILVLSFRRKLKRQQALLARGLHYGVLEIEDGKIIGANDRAEEILLTDLPRLGIQSCDKLAKKTLSGMLEDERCVLVPTDGQLRESDIRTYDHTIEDRTSDGLTSTFYAWVKLRRGWIKIISTVIWSPDDRERVLCTLDTHIDEAHRLFLANVRQGDR
jgi:hypothetical protein